MYRLLLIEDDAEVRRALRLDLEDEGYAVLEAADGASGLASFRTERPDLVLLDLRLPDIRGLDLCRTLRSSSPVPIIIVTAQTDTVDLVTGLEAGADDYVTKPIILRALDARIRALLRRVSLRDQPTRDRITVGHIELRINEATVLKDGRPIELTRTEFHLLCELAENPNVVLSRDHLLERIWGYEHLGDGRLVDAHVHRLRAKIELDADNPTLVVTVRGIGYRLASP